MIVLSNNRPLAQEVLLFAGLSLFASACLSEVSSATSEPAAKQGSLRDAVRASGLDPSTVMFHGDKAIVDGDIAMSEDQLLRMAETQVYKGYTSGDANGNPVDGRRISYFAGQLIKIHWQAPSEISGCNANCILRAKYHSHVSAWSWTQVRYTVAGFTLKPFLEVCSDDTEVQGWGLQACNGEATATTTIAGSEIGIANVPISAFANLPWEGEPGDTIVYDMLAIDAFTNDDLAFVFRHEWGHIFGLRHPIDQCAPGTQCNDTVAPLPFDNKAHISGTAARDEGAVCFPGSLPVTDTTRWNCMGVNTASPGYPTVMSTSFAPALQPDDVLSIIALYGEVVW